MFAVPRREGPDLAWSASGLAWSRRASSCLPRSPPRPLSPYQRGLLPVRLRVGDSPRSSCCPRLCPQPDQLKRPPAEPTVLWKARKAFVIAWAAKGSQQEQRQPGPRWLLSWSGALVEGGGPGSCPPLNQAAPSYPLSQQSTSQSVSRVELGPGHPRVTSGYCAFVSPTMVQLGGVPVPC